MATNDYICVYRQFFEEFARTYEMEDSRPMRVNVYDMSIDELVGEVMQYCVNYLVDRKCPKSLVVPLTKIVVEEFINEAKKQPEKVHTPLKLNKKTHEKISEVCLRYTDNEKLSNLPGPVQETYYATHSTKHTRRRMEDRLICLPRFNTLHGIQSNSEAGYYAIFDGHSGVNAACYAVSHLHQFLAESEFYPDEPVKAFREAFKKTELKLEAKDENSGTTVCAILHQPVEKKLTVAWVGDSLAMLVNEDSYVMLIDPHKPERTDERKRVEALGGYIIKAQSVYRVNGGLAISRAIGDLKYKPFVSSEPEIRVLDLTGYEHFIVMGCDGLWDVVEPREVIETVYFEVKKHGGQIDSVAKRLVDLAKENNSTDNISVIVIFLADPAEISNRSVDVTGHRPKFLHQDGVIMEANFQTNDKSPFSEPGMNGIYETNGNHFNNESDEDFGPETDVDAVDDVLTSPKSRNPFAKDCWQKAGDEGPEKLIEFARQEPKNIEDEILKFAEGFADPTKPVEEKKPSQVNSDEIKSDNFPVDNLNPFDTPVTNNVVDASNLLDNFTDDNNKYLDEISSRKEEADSFSPSNLMEEESFDLKNHENLSKNPQDANEDPDLFSFEGNGVPDSKETPSCTSPQDTNVFCNENNIPKVEEGVGNLTLESPIEKESVPEFSSEFHDNEAYLKENVGSQTNQINVTSNQMDEFREAAFKTNEDAMDLSAQGAPLDATGHPAELCSVIDSAEAERASCDFYAMDKSVASKDGEEPSSDLQSPSAPALDGELKDETVAESGGEIEDSEDDEWNYIKLESGVHQTVPVDSKTSDLVSSFNEVSDFEKPTMNSPLNPEADEFIPVSAMSSNNEFDLNSTPKKAIPQDLTDIIASSPNWNNMNNVSLPEESAFLNEIKSRPSNIFENAESPVQEEFVEKNVDVNNSFSYMSPEEADKENHVEVASPQELRGLDLASDMTSSFIDPSTIGSEIEVPKETVDLLGTQVEPLIEERKELSLNESVPEIQELGNTDVPSKLPDLLSPVPAQEDVSQITPVLDMVQPSPVEVPVETFPEPVVQEISKSLIPEVIESKPFDTNEVAEISKNEPLVTDSQALLETKEPTSPKVAEVVSGITATAGVAAVASAAAAAAVEATAAKKDVKKPAPKTAPTGATKTTAKPLLNGTKTAAPAKKPAPSATAKTPTSGKATGTTAGPVPKTTTPKTTSITKTQPKSTTSLSSTLSKAPTRPRPISATSTITKTSPTAAKSTTVTTSPMKTTSTTTMKPATKTLGTASSLKAKPRVSSATAEKKPAPAVNGDVKTAAKRTELITKKTGGTTTTTTTTTTTRVSLSARPATAPPKPTTLKTTTTTTTTRTVTAKPRTTVSSTTNSSTLTSGSKATPMARKSTIGSDKQAKEVANRITSKTTTSAPKTNGIVQKSSTTTVTKTRKTLTSTTTPTKTKNPDKTENKAEKIVEEKVEIIQSENGAPLIANSTDINIINSIASE